MPSKQESARVNQYCHQPIGSMRAKIKQSKRNFYLFEDGKEIYAVSERDLSRINRTRYALVGVYNKNVELKELREDILWYIKNIMEART